MCLSISRAAALLDLSPRTVINYRSGAQPVPKVVDLAAKYLEERKDPK
jgi:hypothetical protein